MATDAQTAETDAIRNGPITVTAANPSQQLPPSGASTVNALQSFASTLSKIAANAATAQSEASFGKSLERELEFLDGLVAGGENSAFIKIQTDAARRKLHGRFGGKFTSRINSTLSRFKDLSDIQVGDERALNVGGTIFRQGGIDPAPAPFNAGQGTVNETGKQLTIAGIVAPSTTQAAGALMTRAQAAGYQNNAALGSGALDFATKLNTAFRGAETTFLQFQDNFNLAGSEAQLTPLINKAKNTIIGRFIDGFKAFDPAANEFLGSILRDGKFGVAPSDIDGVVRSYISDVIGFMQERQMFDRLDIDARKFKADLGTLATALKVQYEELSKQNLVKAQLAADTGDAVATIFKNDTLAEMRERDPGLAATIVRFNNAQPMVLAMKLMAELSVKNQYATPAARQLNSSMAGLFDQRTQADVAAQSLALTATEGWTIANSDEASHLVTLMKTMVANNPTKYIPVLQEYLKNKQSDFKNAGIDLAVMDKQLQGMAKTQESFVKIHGITVGELERQSSTIDTIAAAVKRFFDFATTTQTQPLPVGSEGP